MNQSLAPTQRAIQSVGRHGTVISAHQRRLSRVAASSADAASSPRRSAVLTAGLLAATSLAAAPSAFAAVRVPDPLSMSRRKGTTPPPPVDALELSIPLRLVSLRGSVPAEAVAGFKAALGKRGGGVVLQPKPQLETIFTELSTPEKGGPKSAATADGVSLGDEWLAAAVSRGLVAPLPGAAAAAWWGRLHPSWRRLVRRAPDGSLYSSGAVYGCPYRWGAVLLAARKDRLARAGVPLPRAWADLLHPRLAGRVALPSSPRLFAAIACACAGVGFNPTGAELEAALGGPGGGGRRGGGRAGAAAASALAATMASLRRAALLVSDRDAGRALAAGDAWVTVGSSPDLGPLAARSAAVVLLAPPEGVPLWADLWAVPALASSGASAPPGTPSPLLPAWLDYCLSPGRADAGRGFGAMAGGASPLVLPPAGGGATTTGGLFGRRRGATPVVPVAARADGLGPGGLPPASTLARSSFLEPVNEIVREALRVAGEER